MNIAHTLETDRLRLEPVRLRDAVFFWCLEGNVEVRAFLGGPASWRRRIARFRQSLRGHPKVGTWVARTRNPETPVGLMVLSPHKDGVDYEVSDTFRPSSWGKGLASEATARVVDHAIDDLGLPRVIAETQTANTASCRMLERLGFLVERRLERFGAMQAIFVTSSPCDRFAASRLSR